MVSPGTACNPLNRPREVGLERAIVDAYGGAGNPYWWNQVPVASGLYGGTAGKRRAIDLIHRRTPAAYDIVELKLGSNTPLFAAVEVLEYGLAWLLSRHHSQTLGYGVPNIETSLLAASEIHLSVLAPRSFYLGADYAAFGAGLDSALRGVAKPFGAVLGFDGFKAMSVEWDGSQSSEDLRRDLDNLYPNPA